MAAQLNTLAWQGREAIKIPFGRFQEPDREIGRLEAGRVFRFKMGVDNPPDFQRDSQFGQQFCGPRPGRDYQPFGLVAALGGLDDYLVFARRGIT